jgi:hypothetical protein
MFLWARRLYQHGWPTSPQDQIQQESYRDAAVRSGFGCSECPMADMSEERVRLKWWDADATTFRKAAVGMDGRLHELPDDELPLDCRYVEPLPAMFGHYWMNSEPVLTAKYAACLDFMSPRPVT